VKEIEGGLDENLNKLKNLLEAEKRSGQKL
jgi:hypothetical protein